MKFSMEILQPVTATLDIKNFVVSMSSMINADSVDITVFTTNYKKEIAVGTLNIKTNFAHLTLEVQDAHGELEDFLIQGIEERTINFA